MYKICIFAGTTEGRKLTEFLAGQAVFLTVCVATEYGKTMLNEKLKILSKRLSEDEMFDMLSAEKYDLVVDATHPYAVEVTKNIESACSKSGTNYIRLLRESSDKSSSEIYAENIDDAVKFLNNTEGNILLTTGSKDLIKYSGIKDFKTRVYARVLPCAESFEACRLSGITPSHIIAMQGPFSEEMNLSVINHTSAKFLVTKDSGKTGGFDTKTLASHKAGICQIVIGRPPHESGMSLSQVKDFLCREFGCFQKTHVDIIGIGPGAHDLMTEKAIRAIRNAECIIGASRMIDSFNTNGKTIYEEISPVKIADIISGEQKHRRIAVLMSGDTGFFSGTKKLLPLLSECEVNVFPGLSSLSYMCAKLKISYEDILSVSVHGRKYDITNDIKANHRVFVLLGGENDVNSLCRALIKNGLGDIKMHIGEKLGYPDEKITSGTAEGLAEGDYNSLSVVLLENEHPHFIAVTGLPDCVFLRNTERKVPMTKSEVRSVCLSKLCLTEDAICWDIGSGTGSVSVEMALKARKGHVYAVDKDESAAMLTERNRAKFSLNNMTVFHGSAPDVFSELPSPTHVFIGGGSENTEKIIKKILERNPSARITATAISLETISTLSDCIKKFCFEESKAVCITVARSNEAGGLHMMMGQNPIYIFTMQNGGIKK